MEGDAPQVPEVSVTQEAQPEVKDVPQTPPPPAGGSTLPTEPKKGLKTKKVVVLLILLPVLAIIAYGIFIAITYWNCNKTTTNVCELGKCGFSLSGFNLISETKANCCGNKICEVGEVYPECVDCPSCDDRSECTKDSFDYNSQQCIYKQIIAPCNVRPITLASAPPKNDYQIKIKLTSSNFDYAKAKTNGEDIRFFDEDGRPLSYWIEDWNRKGESVVWVKVEGSETNKVYMYYGYPSAISASNGSAVFDFFEGFDYKNESELLKVWNRHGSPTIKLSDGIVTIATSGSTEEHGGQYISKNVGADILLSNLFEMNFKRFSGGNYVNHMANIGNASFTGGPASDAWALLRHNPSPDGGIVVFGSNYGGIASPPVGSFNTITIYHQDGVSYAFEPSGTKVAQYSWPMGGPPPGRDYVLLGGTTYHSGFGKASYDWIRIRKYFSTEPAATLGDEEVVSEESPIKELY